MATPAGDAVLGHNRAEAAKLRRYASRSTIWLAGWIGVGLVVPAVCVLLTVTRGDSGGLLLLGAVLAPFVAVGGLLLMGGDRRRWTRALRHLKEAESLGLTFTETPPRAGYERVPEFAAFDSPTVDHARNLREGRFDGAEVVAVDYTAQAGHGSAAPTWGGTVVVFEGAAAGVTDVLFVPRGWLDQLADLVGLGESGIGPLGDARFDKAYEVFAADPAAGERVTGAVRAALLAGPSLVVEVRDGDVLAYQDGEYLYPGQLGDRLTAVRNLAAKLRGGR